MKVLVVDDHKYILASTKIMLESIRGGYKVDLADSVENAEEYLSNEEYDIIFLDLHMGGESSGLSVLQKSKIICPLTRIVILSGDDSSVTVLRCLKMGAVGFISKVSQGGESLVDAIRTTLEGKIYLPPNLLNPPAPVNPLPREKEHKLTPRQREVLFYLCQGMPNKSIANRMGISENTVRKVYVSELLSIFNVNRRTELIVEVARQQRKIVDPIVLE